MESTISGLLKSYESGKLARRDLVRGLALLAAGSSTASAAGFEGSGINHVSLYVSDLQRSTEFYQRVFLCSVEKRDGNNALSLGKSGRLVLRPGNPPGKVDHFAIGVDKFNQDSVTADLKARGATPLQEADAGFHIQDPDGVKVQVIGNNPA
jgi:catechol 2,3-dioxygenase-like lactoylglutathione lyase family enzyme